MKPESFWIKHLINYTYWKKEKRYSDICEGNIVKFIRQRRHTIGTSRIAAISKTLGISTANKDIPGIYRAMYINLSKPNPRTGFI